MALFARAENVSYTRRRSVTFSNTFIVLLLRFSVVQHDAGARRIGRYAFKGLKALSVLLGVAVCLCFVGQLAAQ